MCVKPVTGASVLLSGIPFMGPLPSLTSKPKSQVPSHKSQVTSLGRTEKL